MLPSRCGILAKAIKKCIHLSTTSAVHVSLSSLLKCRHFTSSRAELFLKILQNPQVFPLAQKFPVDFATF